MFFSKKQWLLFLFGISIVYAGVALFIGMHVYDDTKVKSDAILVLGARALVNGTDSPCLVARVNHGVELYKGGYAHTLIVSGWNDEAKIMKKIASRSGVLEKNILEDSNATSTYENIQNAKKIMDNHGMHSLIIVTEPFHEPRASLIAKKLHISYTVSPTLDSPCWTRMKFLSRFFLREPFALVWYKLTGKL